MKEILSLLEEVYGFGNVYSVRIFTDKSGRIYDNFSKVIFEFNDLKELKKQLKKQL
jgi:hypothetical protein